MKDWNDYLSQSLLERMADANSDKDKLKKLSDGIRDAMADFSVSLHYRSSAHCKWLFPIQFKEFTDTRLETENKNVRISFALSDCILVFLITGSFPAQYNGVLFIAQ